MAIDEPNIIEIQIQNLSIAGTFQTPQVWGTSFLALIPRISFAFWISAIYIDEELFQVRWKGGNG